MMGRYLNNTTHSVHYNQQDKLSFSSSRGVTMNLLRIDSNVTIQNGCDFTQIAIFYFHLASERCILVFISTALLCLQR